LFITGVFKSMNKAKKLSQLEQNSQTETE
jgi:hypothetical protein